LKEILLILSLILWAFIPGFPVSLMLTKAEGVVRYDSALVASPLISILLTFVGGNLLNRVGLFPEPSYVLIPIGVALFILIIRKKIVIWSEICRNCWALFSTSTPAIFIGAFVWIKTFESIPFVAPNQDAFHHTLWIRRAMDFNSFRSQDLKVDSPIAQLGSGRGIYPFGWHTSVGSWAPLASVSAPTFALLTVAILWVVFLPLGISVAMKEWLRDSSIPVLPATIAATTFVQVIPVLPGVPLSWGSMTSIIGISFLPFVLAEIGGLSERRAFSHVLYLGLLLLGLVVVHPPEAATAFTFFGLFFIAKIRSFTPATIAIAGGLGLVVVGAAAYTYRGFLTSGIDYVRQYWGAAFPDPTWALGSFFSLSIRVPGTGMAIAVLFISGLMVTTKHAKSFVPIAAFTTCFGTYLLSGGSSEPLSTLRILSMPWYASYERTLWVTVPFAAMFAGVALAKVWSFVERSGVGKLASRAVAISLFFVFTSHQIPQAIGQMRDGVIQSMVVFNGDQETYKVARQNLDEGKVVFALGQDGGSYGYMFEGLPITFGEPLDINGIADDYIATLQIKWREICSLDRSILEEISARVSGILLSERSIPWGTPGISKFEILNIKGYSVVYTGNTVSYLEIDVGKCG